MGRQLQQSRCSLPAWNSLVFVSCGCSPMMWSPLGTFLVHLFTAGIRLHHLPLTCPPLTAAIYLVCLLFWEFLFLLHFFFPVMFLPPSNPTPLVAWEPLQVPEVEAVAEWGDLFSPGQLRWTFLNSFQSRADLPLPRLGPGVDYFNKFGKLWASPCLQKGWRRWSYDGHIMLSDLESFLGRYSAFRHYL